MALYVSLVLAAEFVAVGEHAGTSRVAVSVIWGSAIGLAIAHVFAFNLAARLFAGGRMSRESRVAAWAQLATAAGVAVVVTTPFVALPLGAALDVCGFLLAGMIGLTAYVASRGAGAGKVRSLIDGVVTLAIAILVVSVKVTLTGH